MENQDDKIRPKENTVKTIYYAHALCVYSTPCEQKELKAIRTRFRKCKIVNPSRYSDHPEKEHVQVGDKVIAIGSPLALQ